MSVTDAELIAALLARCGGSVDLGRKELEAAHGWRVQAVKNPMSGDVHVRLVE